MKKSWTYLWKLILGLGIVVVINLFFENMRGYKIVRITEVDIMVNVSPGKDKDYSEVDTMKRRVYGSIKTSEGKLRLSKRYKAELEELLDTDLEGRSFMMKFEYITVANGDLYKCVRSMKTKDGISVKIKEDLRDQAGEEKPLKIGDFLLSEDLGHSLFCMDIRK